MKKRDFLKTLPLWVTPIVTAVSLPSHAETSPPFTPETPPEKPPVDDPPDTDCIDDCPEEPPVETCPPEEWNGYSYKFDKNQCTRNNPVLCIRGETDCPAEYQIIFAKPVLPLRYSEKITGTIPAFTGCVDLGHLLPDEVPNIGSLYEYCISVKQHDGHPQNWADYCSNTNQGGGR